MRRSVRSITGIRSSDQPFANFRISASASAWCAPTPATMSLTNGSGVRTCSSSTAAGEQPLASASYSNESARSRASRRVPTLSLTYARQTSDTGDVLAATGVDLDAVAGVDEQGHLDGEARLHRGRLATRRRPVALEARLGVGHFHLDGGREVDADDLVLVHLQDRVVALEQEAGGVA